MEQIGRAAAEAGGVADDAALSPAAAPSPAAELAPADPVAAADLCPVTAEDIELDLLWLARPELFSDDQDLWGDREYPPFLDDPASDPGLEVFECRDDEAGPDVDYLLPRAAVAAKAELRSVEAVLDALAGIAAMQAQLHALSVRLVHGLGDMLGARSENPLERVQAPSLVAAEVGARLGMPPRTSRALVAEAEALCQPEAKPLLGALEDGLIDRGRTQAILRAAAPVPLEATAAFIEEAVALAVPQDHGVQGAGVAPPSAEALSRRLRRMAEELSSETLERRHRAARERRRVEIEAADDGMCLISAWLPLEDGARIDARLQTIAKSLKAPDESRTTAQLRADAFTDLLVSDGSGEPAVRTEIVVTMPPATVVPCAAGPVSAGSGATSLAVDTRTTAMASQVAAAAAPGVAAPVSPGLAFSDEPGEVLGYGLVSAATARTLASEAATWMRLLVDPATGSPIALGRSRYRPPAALRRLLATRDVACRFPGCNRAHTHTEADHTREWSRGGPTDLRNLGLLCPEHHRLKTLGHWSAEQTGPDGTIVWTSALRQTYTTRPEQGSSADASSEVASPPGSFPAEPSPPESGQTAEPSPPESGQTAEPSPPESGQTAEPSPPESDPSLPPF